MLKPRPAQIVLAVLCAITAALIGTTIWRQFQFAQFLDVGWMGLLALCAAQLAIYGFPAVWGYLGFYRDHRGLNSFDGDAAITAIVLGVVANLIFAAVTAFVQFGWNFTVVSHIVLPFLASAAAALTVFLLAAYRPAVGIDIH